jgi:hypothetical protein
MFRFTIRDVLWLTAVVALAVGWWVHAQRLVHLANAGQRASNQLSELEFLLENHGYERLQTPEGSLMVLKRLPNPTNTRERPIGWPPSRDSN